MRGHPDLNVVFVAMATPEEASAFRAKMRSLHRFACDPERSLHAAYGVGMATGRQVVNLHVLGRGAQAMRYGFGRPTGDPLSLGATVVLDRAGNVRWEHQAADVADNASPAAIAAAISAAG
ncbi:MAG: AhpC/TSA family protein [Fimbriimonas sp.]